MKIPGKWLISGLQYDLSPSFYEISQAFNSKNKEKIDGSLETAVTETLRILMDHGLLDSKEIDIENLCECLNVDLEDTHAKYRQNG